MASGASPGVMIMNLNPCPQNFAKNWIEKYLQVVGFGVRMVGVAFNWKKGAVYGTDRAGKDGLPACVYAS